LNRGRSSTRLPQLDQEEPGSIDRVGTLRLSEFLMTRLAWWVVGSQLITITLQRGDSSSREYN